MTSWPNFAPTNNLLVTYDALNIEFTYLLKKPSLNKEDLSNYRPIANLSFISKLTEKIVKKHLLDYFTCNSLLNPFQSAYTKFYFTETTLLSLH